MSTKTKPVPVHLTRAQIFEIGKVLEDNLVKQDSGTYKYINGWSDAKLAHQHDAKVSQIQKLRKDLFGDLDLSHFSNTNNPLAHSWHRIKALEATVESLTKRVAALEDAVTSPKPTGAKPELPWSVSPYKPNGT